jgi:hypothetical protein
VVANRENLRVAKEENDRKSQQYNQHAILDDCLTQFSAHRKSHAMNELFFCLSGWHPSGHGLRSKSTLCAR